MTADGKKRKHWISRIKELKPYCDLDSGEKDYIRNIFRNLNTVLARVHMKVVKRSETGGLFIPEKTRKET